MTKLSYGLSGRNIGKVSALVGTLLLGLGMLHLPRVQATPQREFWSDEQEQVYGQQLHDTSQGRPHVITYEFSSGPEDFYRVTLTDGLDGSAKGATFIGCGQAPNRSQNLMKENRVQS